MSNGSQNEDLFDALYEKPKPLDYVLPGMLAGTVGSIVSPGGLGKSFFALQIAVHIAGGPDLMGIGPLKQGKVLYLPAEDPMDALKQRIHSLSFHLNEGHKQKMRENLHVECFVGSPFSNLLDQKSLEHIKKLALGKRLIIIDTLRRFHREDENSSGAMTSVIDKLESICTDANCSVIFLHHTSKNSAAYGEKSQSSRGSGVLIDNIRWQGQLVGATSKEVEASGYGADITDLIVKFKICKQNYGPSYKDLWMVRIEGGLLKKFNNVKESRKNNFVKTIPFSAV